MEARKIIRSKGHCANSGTGHICLFCVDIGNGGYSIEMEGRGGSSCLNPRHVPCACLMFRAACVRLLACLEGCKSYIQLTVEGAYGGCKFNVLAVGSADICCKFGISQKVKPTTAWM